MSDDDLSKLLQTWNPPASVSEGFRRNVWARIETSQVNPGNWWQQAIDLLTRPGMAVMAVIAILLAGSLIGSSVASVREETSYLQSVNPYARVVEN